MSNQTPKPETVLRRAINRALRQVRVAMPARVESYDSRTCTATLQPLVYDLDRSEDGSDVNVRLPVVTDVPVYFQGGGGSRLTFPIARGDTGILLWSSSAIDRWLALGGEQSPKSRRHHHVSDGAAFLCGVSARPQTKAALSTTATVLEGSDVRLGDANATALALKSDVDALKTWAATHVHTAPSGGGPTSPPTGSPPSAAGTTKTRAT